MNKSILVIEDDEQLNEIVADYFDVNGDQVYQAYDGIEGLKLFEHHEIDLVVLDIMMPSIDGWSVCRRIRKKSDVLIIMLTARSDEEDKLMGFELGADEYVTKPFSPKVLVARAEALLKRHEKVVSNKKIEVKIGDILLNTESHEVYVEKNLIHLTAREYQLLNLFIEHEKKVFTRDVIIDNLWGYDYVGDGRVVDTNIKTLRRKLGDSGSFIKTVVGVGYRFEVKK